MGTTSLTACSGSNSGAQFLKTLDVSVTETNNVSYVNLSAGVNLGSVQLGSESFSIADPSTGEPAGSISFADTNGIGQITVQVNADLINHGDAALGGTLPNGSNTPLLLNTTPGEVVGINATNVARIYLGGDLKTKILLGVAANIPGLSSVTSKLGIASNIFFSVPFNAELTGVAGIYTSTDASENGIAVFGEYVPAATANVNTILNNPNYEAAKAHDFSDFEKMSVGVKTKFMNLFYGPKKTLNVQ